MRPAPLALRLVLAAPSLAVLPARAAAQSAVLFAASAQPDTADAGAFAVTGGALRYTVTRDGVLRGPLGPGARAVRLPNPDQGEVDRVWGAPHAGALLLAVQWTDGEGFWTEVARFDAATLARRWSLHLPGFNLGPALVGGDTAYLTVTGVVAAVDLRTGRTRWQRGGLYERTGRSDSFGLPRLRGDTLVVPAEPPTSGGPGATVYLLARTGRLLRVTGAPPRAGRGTTSGVPARN
jgi:hypothetical protein